MGIYYFKKDEHCKVRNDGVCIGSLECYQCINLYARDASDKQEWIKCDKVDMLPPKPIQEMSFTDKYSLSKEVLTKREHFAFEFAKIFLNNDIKRGVGDKIMGGARGLSNSSVMVADELIKALNKEKEDDAN